MTRDSDSYDMFQARERGRFGDNESSDAIRGNDSVRSNLVDLKLIYVCHSRSGKAIGVIRERNVVAAPIYLPISQIEFEPRSPMNGQVIQVAMPEWLAKDKGLI